MFRRNFSLILGAVLGLSASSFASPTLLGQVTLKCIAYTSNSGTFEWQVANSNVSLFNVGADVYTYCMSENNLFDPSQSQTFSVYGIDGASVTDIASSGILDNNNMTGLTATHFLEAAAQAESFGTPYGISAQDDANNTAVHNTETNGDSSFDNSDYSRFYYLRQDNNEDRTYKGQPQGYVAPPTPEPASMGALALGAIGLLRRRKQA